MTPLERFRELLELEIGFYKESRPPATYRFICWLYGICPPHLVIIDELEGLLSILDMYITLEREPPVQGSTPVPEYIEGGST